eukprot:scaffold145_cov261-Pinguiococcus_pyrenoidosus.AAC.18
MSARVPVSSLSPLGPQSALYMGGGPHTKQMVSCDKGGHEADHEARKKKSASKLRTTAHLARLHPVLLQQLLREVATLALPVRVFGLAAEHIDDLEPVGERFGPVYQGVVRKHVVLTSVAKEHQNLRGILGVSEDCVKCLRACSGGHELSGWDECGHGAMVVAL